MATPQERVLERLAIRLASTRPVQTAAKVIEAQWRAQLTAKLGGLSPQSRSLLSAAINELVFHYAQQAANSDADRPVVSWIESPPHTWFGTSVPGGRYAADNPDTIYRMVPVDDASSYQLDGRITGRPPAFTLFQVLTDVDGLHAVTALDSSSLVVAPGGTFTLTIDPSPANGRVNHLQTIAGTRELFIRDTLSDWTAQAAPTLSVRRLAGPALNAPPTFTQLVRETVTLLNQSAFNHWIDYITATLFGPPPNAITPPFAASGIARTSGNYQLRDDQALVITAQTAGAAYLSVVLHNVWGVTPAYWQHQSSLTNRQAVPNPNGTYTFVVSTHDPGVANWIDTTGAPVGTFLIRWEGFPSSPTTPSVAGHVVKLADLPSALPAGTRTIDAQQRRTELAGRAAAFTRRLATR